MIPDTHIRLPVWGVQPTLFSVAGTPIPAYSFFVVLGLVAAIALYYFNTRNRAVGNNGIYIAAAAVIGGVLGAKLPIWIANIGLLADNPRPELLLSGRTIVGGIIGGAVAVYLTKRKLGITQRLGNHLVPSLALGILIGRFGCFFAGCCYGTPASLPWAVDFGDHVLRHPTQLYEAALLAGIFIYAQVMQDRFAPGALFRLFVVVYFSWRFAVEFIRVNPQLGFGLTYYQVVAAAVVAYYAVRYASGALGRRLAWTKIVLPSKTK